MDGGGAGSGWASAVEAARPVEGGKGKDTRVDKEISTQEKLTFSIALLVRASLDAFFSFLALGIDALFTDTVLDATEAGARIITLFTCLLTVSASILDLTTLRANLRLRSANHALSERVHMHGQAGVRHGMDSQLRLNRVGGGLGRLIDSVIVGVGVDGSHL
jgi:hypothetical protein